MKKIILSISFFSMAVISQAQVQFGIKGGINFYNFTGQGAKDAGYDNNRELKPGLVLGGFAEVPVSEVISIQPGILYSQEGNLRKLNSLTEVFKFNYINIPVMVKYNDKSGFFGETGFQAGFLAAAKAKIKSNNSEVTTNIKDDQKGATFAWAIGCGYKFKSGIGINARSQWGISSINESRNITSSGFNATVFYMLKRTGKK